GVVVTARVVEPDEVPELVRERGLQIIDVEAVLRAGRRVVQVRPRLVAGGVDLDVGVDDVAVRLGVHRGDGQRVREVGLAGGLARHLPELGAEDDRDARVVRHRRRDSRVHAHGGDDLEVRVGGAGAGAAGDLARAPGV